MAFNAVRQKGSAASELSPPMRNTASWLGACQSPAEYKAAARLFVRTRGLPSNRHPDQSRRAVVLGAVKAKPTVAAKASASLDRSCARRLLDHVRSGRGNDLQVERRKLKLKGALCGDPLEI